MSEATSEFFSASAQVTDLPTSVLSFTTALGLASACVLLLSLALLFLRKGGAGVSGSVSKGSVGSSTSGGAGQRKGSRVSVEDPDCDKPVIRILYGTQTGTAERFSKQISKEMYKKYGDSTIVKVMDIENYSAPDRLHKEKLVVLCMATYGDGEPTDNSASFYTWLQKEVDEVESGEKAAPLEGVTYAVFGLGNKQYEHFNAVGKKVFKSLSDLGAHPLLRRGDGDDDGCIDDDFDKWCADFYSALETKPALVGSMKEGGGADDGPSAPIPAYEVMVLKEDASKVKDVLPFSSSKGAGYTAHNPAMANISVVKELHTSQSNRSCVHVEIELEGTGVKYETGDHVGVFAQNSEATVTELANLLGVDLNSVIKLGRPGGLGQSGGASLDEPPFTGPLSVRTAFSYFVDVLSSPHKESLLALAAFASVPAEADRLKLLGSHEGGTEYTAYVSKPHRSLLEVMKDFPSARPPLGAFFGSVAPRLQPRFYSISSSPAMHPNSVHVTCAVVRDEMPTGRIHEGVASTWFKRNGEGSKVPMFIRHSHFKLPTEPTTPIIMIGPGTGLAPFRGFLQDRAATINCGKPVGSSVLFFGCRNRQQDYIYEQELQGFKTTGALTDLHVAFSREGEQKLYVQHLMEKEGQMLWKLISDQQAHVYVCGDAKHMAKDVHHALLDLIQAGKGCKLSDAEAYVKTMQEGGRYQRDVW